MICMERMDGQIFIDAKKRNNKNTLSYLESVFFLKVFFVLKIKNCLLTVYIFGDFVVYW